MVAENARNTHRAGLLNRQSIEFSEEEIVVTLRPAASLSAPGAGQLDM